MTRDQLENLKKYNAAPFRCSETCGRHYTDQLDYASHVVDCRHIFPALREALQRLQARGLPIVAVSKPVGMALQPELFEHARTHRKGKS